MQLVKRSDWGARRAGSRLRVEDEARQAFMVHYSTGEERGRSDTAEWVREIQAFHMEGQGWADIGYNFLVDKEGRIFEGRGWAYVGAHCPEWNTLAVGVCFLGDDDQGVRDVPQAARRAIRLLYETAVSRAGHGLAIMGHRDGKATSCPGDELYAFVKSNLTKGLGGGEDTPRRRPHRPGPSGQGAPRWPLGPRQVLEDGDHLRRFQRQMRRRGWALAVDGDWGPRTEAVVRAFQREKGLDVDGLVGRRTWAAAWQAPIT